MKLIFATRPSALARWQTGWVIRELEKAWPGLTCEEKVIVTKGDKVLDKPLPEIGGKGLFTQELEAELLSGDVQAAVHSLKDLPVQDPPGLIVGAIPRRAPAQDVLISGKGYTFDTLPFGAVVGTSSLRRSAQILARRPDIRIQSLRGNVDTRIRKAMEGQYDAIVLAGAGVTRLGLQSHISEWLSIEHMLPAPGQGALAIQCGEQDRETRLLLAALEDQATRTAVTTERAFLAALGGGCSLPVATFAEVVDGVIYLLAFAGSADGKQTLQLSGEGKNPLELGNRLAEEALAQGAREFLQASLVSNPLSGQ